MRYRCGHVNSAPVASATPRRTLGNTAGTGAHRDHRLAAATRGPGDRIRDRTPRAAAAYSTSGPGAGGRLDAAGRRGESARDDPIAHTAACTTAQMVRRTRFHDGRRWSRSGRALPRPSATTAGAPLA